MTIADLKYCSKCKQTLPLCEFYACSTGRLRLQGYCKTCKGAGATSKGQITIERRMRNVNRAGDRRVKLCQKCRRWLELTYFHRCRPRLYGRADICKECRKPIMAAYNKMWQTVINPKHARELGRINSHIRRARLANAGGLFTLADWKSLIDRSPRCYWCRRVFNTKRRATHDHIVPLARGGENSPENAAAACRECNTRKQATRFDPVSQQGILL